MMMMGGIITVGIMPLMMKKMVEKETGLKREVWVLWVAAEERSQGRMMAAVDLLQDTQLALREIVERRAWHLLQHLLLLLLLLLVLAWVLPVGVGTETPWRQVGPLEGGWLVEMQQQALLRVAAVVVGLGIRHRGQHRQQQGSQKGREGQRGLSSSSRKGFHCLAK
jgi:hypothetical protein